MATVTLGKDNYDIKDTLKVKEYKHIIEKIDFYAGFAEKIKEAKPEEFNDINMQIQKMTGQDWTFAYDIVKRCCGLTDEAMGNMNNVDMLYLYSEIINESKQPKKK